MKSNIQWAETINIFWLSAFLMFAPEMVSAANTEATELWECGILDLSGKYGPPEVIFVDPDDSGLECSNPDLIPFIGAKEYFRTACISHDYCYRHGSYTYKKSKEDCDSDFYKDLKSLCYEGWMRDPQLINSCLGGAFEMYEGVDKLSEAYWAFRSPYWVFKEGFISADVGPFRDTGIYCEYNAQTPQRNEGVGRFRDLWRLPKTSGFHALVYDFFAKRIGDWAEIFDQPVDAAIYYLLLQKVAPARWNQIWTNAQPCSLERLSDEEIDANYRVIARSSTNECRSGVWKKEFLKILQINQTLVPITYLILN